MIEKIYNYKNIKYKKLGTIEKVAIVLGFLGFCFTLFFLYSCLTEDDGEYYFASGIFLFLIMEIIPYVLFLRGAQNRLFHSLDTWVKTSNNELYFVESNSLEAKNEFGDINFLNRLIQISNNVYNVYHYKAEKLIAIKEYNKYVNVKFVGIRNYDKKSIEKNVYIMKAMNNFNELIDELKNFKSGEEK